MDQAAPQHQIVCVAEFGIVGINILRLSGNKIAKELPVGELFLFSI